MSTRRKAKLMRRAGRKEKKRKPPRGGFELRLTSEALAALESPEGDDGLYGTPKAVAILNEMAGITEEERLALPPDTIAGDLIAARRGLRRKAVSRHIAMVLDAERREPGLGVSVFRDMCDLDRLHEGGWNQQSQQRWADFLRRFARYSESRIEDVIKVLFPDAPREELADALPELFCNANPPPEGERRRQEMDR